MTSGKYRKDHRPGLKKGHHSIIYKGWDLVKTCLVKIKKCDFFLSLNSKLFKPLNHILHANSFGINRFTFLHICFCPVNVCIQRLKTKKFLKMFKFYCWRKKSKNNSLLFQQLKASDTKNWNSSGGNKNWNSSGGNKNSIIK